VREYNCVKTRRPHGIREPQHDKQCPYVIEKDVLHYVTDLHKVSSIFLLLQIINFASDMFIQFLARSTVLPLVNSSTCHEEALWRGGIDPRILNSELDGGERRISRLARFTLGTHWIGCRSGLCGEEKNFALSGVEPHLLGCPPHDLDIIPDLK
jgi:hypothetical protein